MVVGRSKTGRDAVPGRGAGDEPAAGVDGLARVSLVSHVSHVRRRSRPKVDSFEIRRSRLPDSLVPIQECSVNQY